MDIPTTRTYQKSWLPSGSRCATWCSGWRFLGDKGGYNMFNYHKMLMGGAILRIFIRRWTPHSLPYGNGEVTCRHTPQIDCELR